jgi:adenosylmethionine-8-amino-7-oxononanoate aminotransferase
MELNIWSPTETKKHVVATDRYWVDYDSGQRCLDLLSGNFSFILGYNEPDILDAIRNTSVCFLRGNTGETSVSVQELAELLCNKGNWAGLSWAVSGSDAVEAAIAMNDKYWEYQGKHKPKILSFVPGYHGTTMLGKHLRGEYPELNRSCVVQATPWHTVDQQALAEAGTLNEVRLRLENNQDIGCIIFEPMAWCNHITPYSTNWWASIRDLCNTHNVLMIVDDVAMCWGKFGTLYSHQAHNIQPDIVAIGKGLTSGYSPLGAALCNQRVYKLLSTQSWWHGHTWSPNMAGVSAALTVTRKVERLLPQVKHIHNKLQTIGDRLGTTYRGYGLFIAYDTPRPIDVQELLNVGLTTNIPAPNHIKISAPLIADDDYFTALETALQTIFVKK